MNWLRKRHGWTKIIRPCDTHFGTTSIALRSLYDHKADLQALVISNEFKKMLKWKMLMNVNKIESGDFFVNACVLCDLNEKPTSDYDYEGMQQARKGYDHDKLRYRKEVFQGFLDTVKKNYLGKEVVDLTMSLAKFREWSGDAPILQKFVRILRQTTSSSDCERIWGVFERIHSKRWNRLEHQRLNDLVFFNTTCLYKIHTIYFKNISLLTKSFCLNLSNAMLCFLFPHELI
uniref:HAT C-terminal dimerisation domain-containing protein n=1 Tax=Lactuca sativa TaxID=4236 RepID=A0A9R1VLT4_LACSA|nr:hypothetical protein LSAT_V11C500268310 [Lactuca sativa]